MTIIRWEDPPTRHGNAYRPSVFDAMAAALRAKPGQWAIVSEGRPTGSAGGMAYRIRDGRRPFTPRGAFEARCVGSARGTSTVYARFVGES